MKKHRFTLIISVLCLCFLLSYKAYGTFYREDWAPGLGFGLPAYNSVIDADNHLYLSGHTWDTLLASQVTFSNLYMDTGPAIPTLTVSTNQNITFSTINNQEISYTVAANGTQVFSVVSEPLNVTLDNLDKPNSWIYDSSSGILRVTNATSNATILFSSVTSNINTLTTDDVLGIAVAFFAIVIGICVALVYSKRRKEDNQSL
jgi:hypothetical protein